MVVRLGLWNEPGVRGRSPGFSIDATDGIGVNNPGSISATSFLAETVRPRVGNDRWIDRILGTGCLVVAYATQIDAGYMEAV